MLKLKDIEVLLLSEEQVFGENALEVIKAFGPKCAMTDFASTFTSTFFDSSRVCHYFLSSSHEYGITSVDGEGKIDYDSKDNLNFGIRPIITVPEEDVVGILGISNLIENNIMEVEIGEYPQYTVDLELSNILEEKIKDGTLKSTKKTYKTPFLNKLQENKEYKYNGKKYVRVINDNEFKWFCVAPVKWLFDGKSRILISKDVIASGLNLICKDSEKILYDGCFELTAMYKFLNNIFIRDIVPNYYYKIMPEDLDIYSGLEQIKYRSQLIEARDNIKIESKYVEYMFSLNKPVFFHGPSDENKVLEVKMFDPRFEMVDLKNISKVELNGTLEYNVSTCETKDLKPKWLENLEKKCEDGKHHVLYFKNFLDINPEIQNDAIEIASDRLVNGTWPLPDNAKVIISGFEKGVEYSWADSANDLFHVIEVKNKYADWFNWALENNIHPLIYFWAKCKEYDAIENRQMEQFELSCSIEWLRASGQLYIDEKLSLITPLIDYEIVKEMDKLCNQNVLPMDAIINGDYNEEYLNGMSFDEKCATMIKVILLTDEDNVLQVREFVRNLDEEYLPVFDKLWAKEDSNRKEMINDLKIFGSKTKK